MFVFRGILGGVCLGCGWGLVRFVLCRAIFDILTFNCFSEIPCVVIVIKFEKYKAFTKHLFNCPQSDVLWIERLVVYRLLGSDAIQYGSVLLTFRRNVLPTVLR